MLHPFNYGSRVAIALTSNVTVSSPVAVAPLSNIHPLALMVCCGCVQVRYSDRFVEELHLPVEVLSFAVEQPQVNRGSIPSGARQAITLPLAATASEEVGQ